VELWVPVISQPVRVPQEVTVLQSLADAVEAGQLVDTVQSLTVLGFVHCNGVALESN
jgi:hypothetical protein